MQLFKSSASIDAAKLPDDHRTIITLLFQQLQAIGRMTEVDDPAESVYDPDSEGDLVYLEPGDDLPNSSSLLLLGLEPTLIKLPFEGVRYHPQWKCFEAILVLNNSFALSFIIPDADWLLPESRAYLHHLSGGDYA